jgi:hypothetical protein
MGFSVDSPVFQRLLATQASPGLSKDQLREIVRYIDRSPTFTKRIVEFENAGGRFEYSESDTNFFWVLDEKPVVYVSPASYRSSSVGAEDADINGLTEVLAHEMSHFISYFKEKLNPNGLSCCDDAAAAGVRDEARAYAQEYLVQMEINATPGPQVDWMKEGQLEAIEPEVGRLPPGCSTQVLHEAATNALLDWAANWTGPDESAGGYFEFYRNEWLKLAKKPAERIEARSVKMVRDSRGNIKGMEFRRAGTLVATTVNLNPASGTFA